MYLDFFWRESGEVEEVVVRGVEEENGVVGLISDPVSPVQK